METILLPRNYEMTSYVAHEGSSISGGKYISCVLSTVLLMPMILFAAFSEIAFEVVDGRARLVLDRTETIASDGRQDLATGGYRLILHPRPPSFHVLPSISSSHPSQHSPGFILPLSFVYPIPIHYTSLVLKRIWNTDASISVHQHDKN